MLLSLTYSIWFKQLSSEQYIQWNAKVSSKCSVLGWSEELAVEDGAGDLAKVHGLLVLLLDIGEEAVPVGGVSLSLQSRSKLEPCTMV